MPRPNFVSRYFGETVVYGGLLVSRLDMERDLDALGVTGPARLGWARTPAVAAEPEAEYVGGAFRIIATGQILPN